MQTRKAARVLPEPVGAAISVWRPAAISAHPPACGSVGPSGNRLANQVWTAGWKVSITAMYWGQAGQMSVLPGLARGACVKLCRVADPADERRHFAIPPVTGSYGGIELSELDPDDPDHRTILIEADHPELRDALEDDADEIIGPNGEPMNPRLHIAMHEIVANQLRDGDPPEVWETAQRLSGRGYDRHEVLHMLAGVAGTNLWEMLTEKRVYDRDRYLAALAALPESWEKERAEAAPSGPSRPGRARRKKRPKPRGGRRRR
jgi:hypothetical protein